MSAERKSWVDVLQQIAGGALVFGGMAVGAALWAAGKQALAYFAKEKYMEVFLSEEDNLRRKITELARPIAHRERMLADEAIEDWRGRDARPQLQGELDNLIAQRTELEERLAEVEAARRELEDVPTEDDSKSAPGAHRIYR